MQTQQPLVFGQTKEKELMGNQNRIIQLEERIRKYKMGILNANQEIVKLNEKNKILKSDLN